MKLAIVGGGMLGMTLAWEAVAAGYDVTIFESGERCGGLAAPWEIGGIVWDRHYHVILSSDLALRALLSELGLADRLRWMQAQTGFFVDGTLHPFSTAWDFGRFPALGAIDKARLAAMIVASSRITDWHPLEHKLAVDWLTERCGRRTVEHVWLPLLRAKLGPYAERASAAFIWAIIARMYAARRTGMKRELFGYVTGGYETILNRFEMRLRERGVAMLTSSRVESVRSHGSGVVVAATDERYFDCAIVTLAPALAAKICRGLSEQERRLCNRIQYQGIVCASVLLDRGISPYYITNIADQEIPFTAVIEMTALVNRDEEFGGRSLVYLPKYVPPNDGMLHEDDRFVESIFLGALERMHPAFTRSALRAFQVSRVPYVFPIPTLHYSMRLMPIVTSVPGLFVVNSSHIVNGTLNANETVTLARRAWSIVDGTSRRLLKAAV